MRRLSVLFGALILAVGVLSCGGGGGTITPPPMCAANTICLESQTFFPASLSVAAGTTVTFENDSGIFHNVVWNDAAGVAAAGAGDGTGDIGDATATHTRKFTTAGTYGFHCTVHFATMTGTLTVTP
ncbi:MAG TPA: plastocyanin/azurin family copper-binding protein [Gemmatimonadaceae bacterium]